MSTWLIVVIIGAGTYLTRLSFIGVFGRRGLPAVLEAPLRYVAPAVLAAIAIPGFIAWAPDARLRSAARDLYSNLQRAKIGAIRSNAEWRVYFDNSVSPGRYFLLSGDGGDGWDTPTTLGGNDVEEMIFNLSAHEGVDYGNGNAEDQIEGFGDGNLFGSAIDFETNATSFTPRGTVALRGYVYLTNVKGTCYAVGTPSPAGVISLRRWLSGAWQ